MWRRSRGGAGRRSLRWLALTAVAAGAVAQPSPEVQETVEVRVVNVDVVVTDGQGRPVRGLRREHFELRVDGRPVKIDYFAPVEAGQVAGAGEPGEAEHAVQLPYLVIAYDGSRLRTAGARQAIDELADRLDVLLARTRAVMVVRQGRGLIVEEPLTRDRERLAAALMRLVERRVPSVVTSGRAMLMRQMEQADPPVQPGDLADEMMAEEARRLLSEIRTQAEVERFEVDAATRQLRALIRSVAGLPGRKAILYIGEGLRLKPGEALYRLWWSQFSRYARRLGIVNIESELSQVRSDQRLSQLVAEANAHRVSFHSFDPGGLRTLGASAEFSSLEANQHLADETERQLETLVDLALGTGGIGDIRSGSVAPLLDEMLGGFNDFYSLGFDPGERQQGEIRVRLPTADLRVRHLSRFTVRTTAQELEEATLAALLTAAEDNRLEVSVELGKAEPQEDGTLLVPVLIKVPLSRLALLPQRSHHVGRLSFVVMARSADGDLSPAARGEVPIEIANGELLSAMGRTAAYRLLMRMAAGEQTVVIGVRDEVAREDATLRLVVTPGRGA